MWILKCAGHFSTGDFSRLLTSANSTEPCSEQSLKVLVTDFPFIDNVTTSSAADTRDGHCHGFVTSLVVLLRPTELD